MTTTRQARDSRGHYLPASDVHTTLSPDDWDDTCWHTPATVQPEPSTETFGHKPVIGFIDGRALNRVCARCRQWDIYGYSREASVRWPCTSAIVLGLVERDGATP